jgi:opacity protein-like surface antigen
MVARLTISTMAALASLGTTALAADYYQQPLPPPVIYQAPQQQGFAEGWYLRGYVGVGMNAKPDLIYTTQTNATLRHHDISDSTFLGAAIGYEWNS